MFARFVFRLLIAACLGSGVGAEEARLLGSVSLTADHEMWGGMSALEVTDSGRAMWALSDRGALIRAEFQRDPDGRVVGIELLSEDRLDGRSGERGNRAARDSEGLALAGDGRLYISFEGDHRVALYAGNGQTETLPVAPEFSDLQPNSSLEALAIDANGHLYTLPERSGEWERPFPLFRFIGTAWDSRWSIPREGRFLPVGADFDDLGRFYLLERDFRGLFGFATRLRRFELGVDGMGPGLVLMQTRHGRFSNLEGLSIWRDGQGRLVATMISDDNFSPFLPTQLVEISLPD